MSDYCVTTKPYAPNVQDIYAAVGLRPADQKIRGSLFLLLPFLRAVQLPDVHADHSDPEHHVRRKLFVRVCRETAARGTEQGVSGHALQLHLFAYFPGILHAERPDAAGRGGHLHQPAEQPVPLSGRLDHGEHAHENPAADAQRDVLSRDGHERRLFFGPAQGRHHLENHLRRGRGAVLHHQHPAGVVPRTVSDHRLYRDDGGYLLGAGRLLGAVSPGGGAADRQHRQKTPPPGPHQPTAHGRDGRHARRIARGH